MNLLADIVLALHVLVAAFIALGFVAIPLGAWYRWNVVRRRSWRRVHLAAILFVALESALGMACPLTVWEDALRGGGVYEVGFIAGWLRRLLYYDVPLWMFSAVYLTGAVLALLLWRWVPPAARCTGGGAARIGRG